MLLYYIRHADPSKDQDALTPMGHLEAEVLADTLQEMEIDEIYVSPLQRAQETAKPTVERLGKKPVVLEWLREPDWWLSWSQNEKRSAWNVPGEKVRTGTPFVLPEEFLAQYEDFKKISDQFLAEHGYERIGRCYRPVHAQNKRIVFFAHGGIGLNWLSYLLDIPLTTFWTGFWLDPASITTIHFEQHSEQWAVPRCLGFGDVFHLRKSGLRPQNSSIFRKFEP